MTSAGTGRFSTDCRSFTVLDPACCSGNFLYLALQALKDLEPRVQVEPARRSASSEELS